MQQAIRKAKDERGLVHLTEYLVSAPIVKTGPFPSPIRNVDIPQPSSAEMESVSMESIKDSVRRASEYLKSLIVPSHTPFDEPSADEAPRTGNPLTPSSLEGLSLSPRVFNCLFRSDIRTIETVDSMSDENLNAVPRRSGNRRGIAAMAGRCHNAVDNATKHHPQQQHRVDG